MGFLIFSKNDGFLNNELEWTTKLSEARVISGDEAKAAVPQIVKQGLTLAPKSACCQVMAEQLPSWIADNVFEEDADKIEYFCAEILEIFCQRVGENSWIVHQAGGHRTKCDTSKMRHFADEVLKSMTGNQLLGLAKDVLGQNVYQVGADIIAIRP